MLTATAALAAAVVAVAVQQPSEPRFSRPETLLELKARELKGVPTRLAWAPDGSQLYLRISRFDRWSNETASHVIVTVATRSLSTVTGEPGWAAAYWTWKSAPSCPADETWRFAFDAREEQVRTTNVPRGGDIAGFMAEPGVGYDELARKAILANQKVRFETLRLNGQLIDQTVNTSLIPGRRFGWAPPSRLLLAFANHEGRLALMHRDGHASAIGGTSKVLLPAWSEDGRRIAFVERVKSNRYALKMIVDEGGT